VNHECVVYPRFRDYVYTEDLETVTSGSVNTIERSNGLGKKKT